MARDIVYAKSEEGGDLAVIDVTNPAFTLAPSEAELGSMAEQYIREAGRREEMPEALREACGIRCSAGDLCRPRRHTWTG
jgi:hypothetical protein